MSATYKIIRDDQEKTFENRDQFEDTRDLLEQNGVEVENHFAGERIGKRKQLLRQATATMENDTLC